MYNGIKQNQYDGTTKVADSVRLDRITHTATLSPMITFQGKNDHSISLNLSFVQNQNLNKLYYANSGDVMTLTGGVGYNITFTPVRVTLNVGYDYSLSRSEGYNYNAHTLHYGVNFNIMNKEKLNWNAYYNGSAGYNIVKDGDNNFSLSNCLGSSFNYNSAHTASLYLSLSNFSEDIVIGQKIATALDCRFTLSYSYSFQKVLIKKKEGADKKKEDKLTKKLSKMAEKDQNKNKNKIQNENQNTDPNTNN